MGWEGHLQKKQPQEKFSTKPINIIMVSADVSSPCMHLQMMIGTENLRDACITSQKSLTFKTLAQNRH